MLEISTQIILVVFSGFENTAIRHWGHNFGEPQRPSRGMTLLLNRLSANMGIESVLRRSDRVVRDTGADHFPFSFRFEENAAMSVMAISFSGEEKTCMSRGIILYKSSVVIE